MRLRIVLALAAFVSFTSAATAAELRLPGIFSDHAVLQADVEVPIWGWSDAGQKVEITLGKNAVTATAAANGKWMAKLPAMHASDTPVEIVVKAGDASTTIADVLVGEVWLGSGQSNMAFAMSRTDDAKEAIAAATEPTIRLFAAKRAPATQPALDSDGRWEICSPKTVAGFSAVLYHFGKNIQDTLKTPVGLIHSSWGGTPIQAWMPREAFEGSDDQIAAQRKRIMGRYPESTAPTTNRAPRTAHLEPTNLFNGMIHPLAPYAMRGVLWYQGENNVHQGDVSDYASMMKSMVASWRKLWAQGNWQFLYVQIAPYGKYPANSDPLPKMWEQQTMALSMIANSGMAAISDLGNPSDIHPKNKREVGRRLALIALAKNYKQPDVADDAPMFSAAKREENKVRVQFRGAQVGLISRDGKPLDFFELAGADGEFKPANAAVEGETVIVESDQVTEPRQIRFGWSATAAPNLVNKAGLPAVAFRADVK